MFQTLQTGTLILIALKSLIVKFSLAMLILCLQLGNAHQRHHQLIGTAAALSTVLSCFVSCSV